VYNLKGGWLVEYRDWKREYVKEEQRQPSAIVIWNAAQRHGRQPADVQELKSKIADLVAQVKFPTDDTEVMHLLDKLRELSL
jgi:hypothetical protein